MNDELLDLMSFFPTTQSRIKLLLNVLKLDTKNRDENLAQLRKDLSEVVIDDKAKKTKWGKQMQSNIEFVMRYEPW